MVSGTPEGPETPKPPKCRGILGTIPRTGPRSWRRNPIVKRRTAIPRPRPQAGRPVRLAALAAWAALAVTATGCGAPGPEGPPPVVLISIDTLRADRLPAYGYGGVETPAIDALAAAGLVFERAFSHSPLTLPAHASLLTGLLPPDHGVRSNVGYKLAGERLPSLARRLGELGYATGAAVSSFVLRRETGMDEGFDFFEDRIDLGAEPGAAGLQRRGPATLAAARPWLESVAGRPFFLFFHIYEPHTPYDPPEPFRSRYPRAYDGEVAAADAVVGELVAELSRLGVYDRSLVVLTSDHGEGLGEHGEDEHGVFLYRESLEIPLIVKLPGGARAGERVPGPAQLADVAPTVLEVAGAGAAEGLAGESLLALPRPGRRVFAETFYPRFYFGWSELFAVFDGRFHLIESPEPELYDLDADPFQERNLAGSEPRRLAELRRTLRGLDLAPEPPAPADVEAWEKLAALGNVGHGQVTAEGELPAPAGQAALLAELKVALAAAAAGRTAEAAAGLEAILASSPRMLAAWEELGRARERLGRPREALAAYERAIELADTAPHLRLAAARLAAGLGRLDEARAHAQAALAWDEAAARVALAQIALLAGDAGAAEREARAALAARRPNTPALIALAQAAMARGRAEEALALVDEAAAEAGGEGVPRLELLRANLLARAGRPLEAEAALEREIERFPAATAAYLRLAALVAGRGDAEGAAAVLDRMVAAVPEPEAYAAAVRALRRLGLSASARRFLESGLQRFPDSPELAAATSPGRDRRPVRDGQDG